MKVYANTPLEPFPSGPLPSFTRVIAGFWRRVLAFAVDGFVSALPCGILGFVFYNFFSKSELVGTLIGFPVTLLYFAVMGSSIGEGQTIGHRITHIQVIDGRGKFITLKRSLFRYAVLLGPILLSAEVLPPSTPFRLKAALDWLIFGGEVAIAYLCLFNRSSGQSLHDLATGTYVVDAESIGTVALPRLWGGHLAILGGVAFFGIALTIGFGKRVDQSGLLPELSAIQEAVLRSGKVQSAAVSIQRNWTNGKTATGIIVNVVWRDKLPDAERGAAEVANIALRANSQVSERDFITVNFREGFMIGFATYSKTRRVTHDPQTWIKQAESYGLR